MTENKTRRPRRTYTDEFKNQLVQFHLNEKRKCDIIREYDILLFNREIIGYSAGRNKDAVLVSKAFSKVKVNLNHIKIFHTDRGNEFKNKLIDETLESFQIQRSLSMKGCPYDNAVAEATYKIIKLSL